MKQSDQTATAVTANDSGESLDTVLPSWLSSSWQHVLDLRARNRLPHALLICGPEGIGKRMLAQHLAAALTCSADSAIAPCGGCKSCRLVQAGTHADVRRLSPEEGSKVIKVDAVRTVAEFLNQSAQIAQHKVAVLSPADALNINAANALLKTLEEPTENSFLILVSDRAGDLLPTIRSRCQRIDLAMPAATEASQWLQQHSAVTDVGGDAAEQMLTLAGGAPLKALAYLQAGAHTEIEVMQRDLVATMRKEQSMAETAAKWADDTLEERLLWMLYWLERIIRACVAEQGAAPEGQPATKMFNYLAQLCEAETLFALREQHLAALRQFRSAANPNAAMLLESLLGGWMRLMVKKRVSAA